MLSVRPSYLATPVVVLSLVACDRRQPVDPAAPGIRSVVVSSSVKAPSGANAVAPSESRIDVSWQDNSSNETGFEVHRSTSGASGAFALLASKGAGVASHSDLGLAPSTQYCYKVRAFRTTGGQTGYSEFSTAACATTLAPPIPAAPSGADARPASSSAVAVSWIDRSTNETGFRVERSLDLGATWTSTRTTGANAISSSDEGLASEQPVCYRVIAFNARGDSPPSNSDCTTPPAAPTGLTATAAEGPAIDLVWTDNSAVEDGYEIRRATDGAAFGILTDVPPNSTTYHDAGATTNATYSYQVRAKKDGGYSDLSRTASAVGSCVPASVTEICDNGVDDDCNGLTDGSDPACSLSCSNGCPPGYVCAIWVDVCVPHCGDGFQNGDEGDVDCGGSCATRCTAGQHCWVSSDCASFSCVNDICQ